MPEDTKPTEKKPEETAAQNVSETVRAVLREVIPEVAKTVADARPVERPAPVQQATFTRPSADDIAEATIAGDKSKLAQLYRQRDAFDDEQRTRAITNLTTQGGHAIGSIARETLSTLPDYKRFKKEIDTMLDQFGAANQGIMLTPEICRRAYDNVRSQHLDELIGEAREEAIRKAREPETPLEPTNERGERVAKEPESLKEVLVGDWDKEFREKQGKGRRRSEDEELYGQGYRGGFKEFIQTRRNMEQVENDTNGAFGLDQDFDPKTGKYVERDRFGRIIEAV